MYKYAFNVYIFRMERLEPVGFRLLHTSIRQKNTSYMREGQEQERNVNVLFFVLEGEVVFVLNGKNYPVRKQELFWYHTHHRVERIPKPGKSCSFMVVSFELIGENRLFEPLGRYGIPFHIRTKQAPSILKLIRKMHDRFHGNASYRLTECAALGLQLTALLCMGTRTLPQTDETAVHMHHRIREALAIIQERYKEAVDLKALARQVCMHPSYFTHRFKKEVGVAPSQYLLDVKIAKAKDYLLTFNSPISKVGAQLGFHDNAHFYRTFKAKVGMTPRAFLQQHKAFYDPQ